MNTKQFIQDRRAALLSFDRAKVCAYLRKYGSHAVATTLETAPEDVWLLSVHKAIAAATDLPIEVRQASKQWLKEHGSRPL